MEFTGENKKNFEKWLKASYSEVIYGYYSPHQFWSNLPLEFQKGVIEKYYQEHEIIIETSFDYRRYNFLVDYQMELMDKSEFVFTSKEEAFKKACDLANKIMNERLTT